jgi:hypothetical protein
MLRVWCEVLLQNVGPDTQGVVLGAQLWVLGATGALEQCAARRRLEALYLASWVPCAEFSTSCGG